MCADRPNRVDRSREPKLKPLVGERVHVQAAEQPPSDQQLRASAEAVSAREREAEAIAALQRLFPDYQANIEVRLGGRKRGMIDGAFEGEFRGRAGRWIVEFATAEQLLNRYRLVLRPDYFSAYGDDKFDGVLIVVPETSADREMLAQRAIDIFPGKQVEIATFREIEELDDVGRFFDIAKSEYPGRVVEIGHNSEAYRKAMEALDAVATELRTSNSLNLKADIRDRLYVEVKSGRTLFEATTVRAAAVAATLVPTLLYIGDVCAKAALGELAKEALKALAKLFFS